MNRLTKTVIALVLLLLLASCLFLELPNQMGLLPCKVPSTNETSTTCREAQTQIQIIERLVGKKAKTPPVEKVVDNLVEKEVVREVKTTVERVVYKRAPVRVYVYDLPSRFHADFYAHPDATKTPHAAEWWIYLDIIHDPNERDNSASIRVTDSNEADVFLVPFMASQAFNCNNRYHFLRHNFREICGSSFGKNAALQEELREWLESQEPWQRSGGIDHVLLSVHPVALARLGKWKPFCTYLIVDFAFRESWESSLEKDVVIPYSHLTEWLPDDLVGIATSERFFEEADKLLFFAGSLDRVGMGRIRKALQHVLGGEADVSIGQRIEGQGALDDAAVNFTTQSMRSSKFCLHPAGDTPSSVRLFDAIANLCVPVIVSDDLEIPFEGQVDVSKAFIVMKESDAVQPGHLLSRLRAVSNEELLSMKRSLAKVREQFEYSEPWKRRGGATSMIWREIAARLPLIRLRMARRARGVARLGAATHDKLELGRRFEDGH